MARTKQTARGSFGKKEGRAERNRSFPWSTRPPLSYTWSPSLVNTGSSTFIAFGNTSQTSVNEFDDTKNEWKEVWQMPKSFQGHNGEKIAIHIQDLEFCAYDKKQKVLYMNVSDGKLVKLSIDQKKEIQTAHIWDEIRQDKGRSYLVLLNDSIHCMGEEHIILDVNGVEEKRMDMLWPLICGGTAIAKDQNIILLMGGRIAGGELNSGFFSFCAKTHKWSKSKCSLPEQSCLYSVVKTCDERYIIILGGLNRDLSDVYVWDTLTDKVYPSKVMTPTYWECNAVITSTNEEMVTFGFIHELFQGTEYQHMPGMPFYLTKIVQGYYVNEKIHLIPKVGLKHWSINVDVIINSKFTL